MTTCRNAALHGNLEILKYLHEIRCPRCRDENTCNSAALNNHLEVSINFHNNSHIHDIINNLFEKSS